MKSSGVIRAKPLLICLAIPLAIGALSGFLSKDGMDTFQKLQQPPLSPPAIVFPIVWTILYLLMGISCYSILLSRCPSRRLSLFLYGTQLFLNFLWPLTFFNLQEFLLSFLLLLIIWGIVILMMISFYSCNKCAALLQIPYLIWLTFAGYLNLSIYLLNPVP